VRLRVCKGRYLSMKQGSLSHHRRVRTQAEVGLGDRCVDFRWDLKLLCVRGLVFLVCCSVSSFVPSYAAQSKAVVCSAASEETPKKASEEKQADGVKGAKGAKGVEGVDVPSEWAGRDSRLPQYAIDRFVFRYLKANPGHPPLDELLKVQITLGVVDGVYVAPVSREKTNEQGDGKVKFETRSAGQWSSDKVRLFDAAALQLILVRVRDELTSRKLLGIYVAPDSSQITSEGKDLRLKDDHSIRIVITTGVVTRIRTLAHGKRIDPDVRIDNPLHDGIRERSPVQPNGSDQLQQASQTDLIRKNLLDDYTSFLSRHPGRRVDVALAPSPVPGGVNLDYLVTEVKPWLLYAKVANTGARNTNDLRYQFGFRQYQLTNNDDVLSIDYVTSGFEDSHAVFGSYEAPLGDCQKFRWRAYGGWSEYTSSDVGFFDDDFSGESYHMGIEGMYNVYQRGDLFVDLGGGVRFEQVDVTNTLPGSMPGSESFVFPYVRVRAERYTDAATTLAELTLEFQSGSGVNASGLDNLGRMGTDEQWTTLQWQAAHSFYLEPLLDREAWQDPSAPGSSTLSHEIYLACRGQYAFGDRVAPQYEQVAGGFYTVRGYDEAITSGDTVVIGTAEYRVHVPRLFALEREPRQLFGEPFRYARQQVYGPVDWDLILKGFLDVGHVIAHSGNGASSDTDTLAGTGVGVEVQYRRNVTLRADWGVALHEVPGIAKRGSSRVHFALTLSF
jgi:hemolysin activation/secretion protein